MLNQRSFQELSSADIWIYPSESSSTKRAKRTSERLKNVSIGSFLGTNNDVAHGTGMVEEPMSIAFYQCLTRPVNHLSIGCTRNGRAGIGSLTLQLHDVSTVISHFGFTAQYTAVSHSLRKPAAFGVSRHAPAASRRAERAA